MLKSILFFIIFLILALIFGFALPREYGILLIVIEIAIYGSAILYEASKHNDNQNSKP